MTKLPSPDQRSTRFIFTPFCLTCQAFQAQGIVRFGYSSVMKQILNELVRQDLNIVQLPCPESQLGGYAVGLKRQPKGIRDYDTQEFRSLCDKLAGEVVCMIKGIIANGFQVVGILGIEFSPSCSVKLQYTNKGTIRRPGHFICALQKLLRANGICIPFVGINRRGIGPTIRRIRELCITATQEQVCLFAER
jgi:predicted secreted protein